MSRFRKKAIALVMIAAVIVSGAVFWQDRATKAADLEPQVKVLGATILEESASDGSQSMRLAIQVLNASYADMCGIEVSVEGSTKEPVLISTDNESYRKIYSRHENLDIVVYTVVVNNIPNGYFDTKINFKGVVRKLGDISQSYTYETETTDRTVTGIANAVEESLLPVAEKQVNVAQSNLAYSSVKNFTDNGDGTVTIELSRESGGLSVGYYINDNKSPINLDDYSKMVLNVTSGADQTGSYSVGFGGPYVDEDYWVNDNQLKKALQYNVEFAEGTYDYTFTSDIWSTWDESYKTQSVVYIQAAGDSSGESNTFTLNSITFYKNTDAEKENPDATPVPVATASPTPEPTETPAATARPTPPAATAPEGEDWQQLDLNTVSIKDTTKGGISESGSLILAGAEYVQVPLNTTYESSQIIKVYITGISYENSQAFRVWSGGRFNSRISSDVVSNSGESGVAFTRELTLIPKSNPDVTSFNTFVICSINFALQDEVASGETVNVTIKGTYAGTNGFRVWIGNGHNSYVENLKVFNDSDLTDGAEFEETFALTTNNTCTKLTIKSIGNTPINGLTINQIIVTKNQ